MSAAASQRAHFPWRPFLLAIGVLTLAHVYVGWSLWPGFSGNWSSKSLLLATLTASALLIPSSMLAPSLRQRELAQSLAWSGYSLMGFFSSLFVLTLFRGLVLRLLTHWPLQEALSGRLTRSSALGVGLLALAASILGLINARRSPAIVRVDVPIEGLPQAFDGLSLVQISDLHVGPTIKRDYVERVVDKVNALNADVVVVTGDLVDGRVSDLAADVQPLARLRGKQGVLAVTGNHEYYSGADAWVAEYRRLGMQVLQNTHVVLVSQAQQLVIAGVPDYTAHQFNPDERSDPSQASLGSPASAKKILLAHQPRSADAAERAGFDLQLSGHTHGGQFWPWNLFVPLQQPYTAGLHRHGRMWVYTNLGTGYWGPPKRLGTRCEISHIRLRRA